MLDFCNSPHYELLCVIVNNGMGSKVIKVAKQNGILGGTIFLGYGTVKNHLLELLDLTDSHKEVALMLALEDTVDHAMEALDKKFSFHKPNHGIAFSIPIKKIIGMRNCNLEQNPQKRGVEKLMYQSIFVVVDKGNAEGVIDAAVKAGSKGGTIINARGSGIHETSKLFSMDIEPEKEIVLILTEEKLTDAITTSINDAMKLDELGNGIMFVQDVSKTIGIY